MLAPEVQRRMEHPALEDATPIEIADEIYDVIGSIDADRLTPSIESLRLGPSIIDASGIRLFNSGIPTVYLDHDGDAFFGSNLDDPAFTSLIIFSNGQDYNNEDFEEGDLLVGDNSPSRANMFWDRSAGKLQFRGGTTMQVEIGTDGSLLAGAGSIVLDASGITVDNNINAPRWKDTNGAIGATIRLRNTNHLVIQTQNAGADIVLSASADMRTHADSDHLFLQNNQGGVIQFFQKLTDASTPTLTFQEDPANANRLQLDLGVAANGAKFTMGGEVEIHAGVNGLETVFNGVGRDIDFRVEGDTRINLLLVNAGTDSVSIDGFFGFAGRSELTIATGVVTATRSFHAIDTQNDDSTDDLDTINGGVQGDILVIRAINSARTVVVKDAVGNIFTAGDFSMDHNQDRLTLMMGEGSNWFELSRSSNA